MLKLQDKYQRYVCYSLLLIAIASAAYLSYLYIQIHGPSGSDAIDSFCNVSKKINCSKVSLSKYSTLWGVPNAFLGLQYYCAALLLVLMLRRTQIWQQVLWLYLLVGLPNIGYLAFISLAKLHTLCLMCAVLYVCHITIMIMLCRSLSKFNGLLGSIKHVLVKMLQNTTGFASIIAVALIGLSQFLWLPKILADKGYSHTLSEKHGSGNNVPGQNHSTTVHVVKIDHEKSHVSGTSIGNPAAPLQIIGYSDFQCPLCKKAHIPLFQFILEHLDEVHFTHRDYPLDEKCNRQITGSFHDHACDAAFFARCMVKHDRFFEISASLYHMNQPMDATHLSNVAVAHGLSWTRIQQCMKQPDIHSAIEEDIDTGIARELKGTPTFIVNGITVVGAKDRAWWESALNGHIQAPMPK